MSPDATFVLQANDYTVEIDKRDGLEDSVDTMELTLLTTQRAHERLQTYNAPSATEMAWPWSLTFGLKNKLFNTDRAKFHSITFYAFLFKVFFFVW